MCAQSHWGNVSQTVSPCAEQTDVCLHTYGLPNTQLWSGTVTKSLEALGSQLHGVGAEYIRRKCSTDLGILMHLYGT